MDLHEYLEDIGVCVPLVDVDGLEREGCNGAPPFLFLRRLLGLLYRPPCKVCAKGCQHEHL